MEKITAKEFIEGQMREITRQMAPFFPPSQVIVTNEYLLKYRFFGKPSADALRLLGVMNVLNMLFNTGLQPREMLIASLFFPFNSLEANRALDEGVAALYHAHICISDLTTREIKLLRWSKWDSGQDIERDPGVYAMQAAIHIFRGGGDINREFVSSVLSVVMQRQQGGDYLGIDEINKINTDSPEGKLLMAAIARLSTSAYQDKTPNEILNVVVQTANAMYMAPAEDEKQQIEEMFAQEGAASHEPENVGRGVSTIPDEIAQARAERKARRHYTPPAEDNAGRDGSEPPEGVADPAAEAEAASEVPQQDDGDMGDKVPE